MAWVMDTAGRLGRWFKTQRKLLPEAQEFGGELGHLCWNPTGPLLAPLPRRTEAVRLPACLPLAAVRLGQEPPP